MQLLWEGISGAARLLAERDPLVLDAAFRTLWISLLAVGFAALLGVPAGVLLARRKFVGRTAAVVLFRAGMSLPTVLIGLVCYSLFTRRGPLGGLDLLYTPAAIVVGEIMLAFPIIVCWTHNAITALDTRVAETAWTLGAGWLRRGVTYLSEVRLSIILALLTAYARCITELGIAMMVGGNLKFRTRTLTTATALESGSGEFARGVAMSSLLLTLGLVVALVAAWVGRQERES